MDLADNWLGVPKLLTPEEIINPAVDEQSMMTYLSQFPNAKVKEGAPFREKALASKVRAHGPGKIALFRLHTGCPQKQMATTPIKLVKRLVKVYKNLATLLIPKPPRSCPSPSQ